MAVSVHLVGQVESVNFILQVGKNGSERLLFDQNHTAQKRI